MPPANLSGSTSTSGTEPAARSPETTMDEPSNQSGTDEPKEAPEQKGGPTTMDKRPKASKTMGEPKEAPTTMGERSKASKTMGEPSKTSGTEPAVRSTETTMGAELRNKQQMHKVPSLLQNDDKTKGDYIPMVVSIGPHHHGKPELSSVESFKPTAVNLFTEGSLEDSRYYRKLVSEEIAKIRSCYHQSTTANFTDEALAEMMIRDACFIIVHMETFADEEATVEEKRHTTTEKKRRAMLEHLGMLTVANVQRDLLLAENQIPLSVIKLLIKRRYGNENVLYRYLNALLREYSHTRSASKRTEAEDLHLLAAVHRLVVRDCITKHDKTCKCRWLSCCFGGSETARSVDTIGCLPRFLSCKNRGADNNPESGLNTYAYSFHSVTELKAKGIHFRPSSSSLKDVRFTSRFLYAWLELPVCRVSKDTRALFLNMIASESNPNSRTGGEVTSYVKFMKSLIQKPEDVKELREKKILYNTLGSDEEILNVYKDINIYAAENPLVFKEVKNNIEVHCNNLMKTWMAELNATHFRTPWTAIAFLAATALLALTAVQVHYAIHPKSK